MTQFFADFRTVKKTRQMCMVSCLALLHRNLDTGISQFKGEIKKKRDKKEQINRSHSLSKSLAKEGGC